MGKNINSDYPSKSDPLGIPTKNLISCMVIFMEPMGDTKKKSFIERDKMMHQNTKALVSERNGSF